MTTPIESLSHLVVGSVESVAPDKIGVLLELDAPSTTALNTGTPTAFPRLNSYVLIPNEAGATVAYVAWMGIERSAYPKRAGFKDFGLVGPWFMALGMEPDSVIPVHLFVDPADRIRCVRLGALEEDHYDTVKALLKGG